jgi:hypothetical protein
MSAQLTIYIHKIGEPIKQNDNDKSEGVIELFWFSTSPTRELYEVLPATCYDDVEDKKPDPIYGFYFRVLSTELLQGIYDFYTSKIEEYKKIISDNRDEIKENNDLIVKSSSLDVVKELRQENRDIEDGIKECESELSQLEFYNQEFHMAEEILQNNNSYSDEKPTYELVYDMD